jgi:hypothetical protein
MNLYLLFFNLTPFQFLQSEDSTPPLHVERGERNPDCRSVDGVRLRYADNH